MPKNPSSVAPLDPFASLLPRDERVEMRRLFGNPCGYVNGTMFTGIHESQWILRVSPTQRTRLIALHGGEVFEPMRGRPMNDYVRLPREIADDRRRLRGWIRRAFEYCAALPAPAALGAASSAKR
ncbi:MAG: TfoX/Sxy family protein [Deltaproteobacteria bacterium]|nr:TfoX/Sxy family protein [Deltaproteobacteria bacterium]